MWEGATDTSTLPAKQPTSPPLPEPAHQRKSRWSLVRIKRSLNGCPRLSFVPPYGEKIVDVGYAESEVILAQSVASLDDVKSFRESVHFAEGDETPPEGIATPDELTALTNARSFPPTRGSKTALKWRYHNFSYYRRLWAACIAVNIAFIIFVSIGAALRPNIFTYGTAATAAGANLCATALARHEHFVNMLFRLACALPLRAPLWIRRRAAKVYTYGGFHSGCGISALLWYPVYSVLVFVRFDGTTDQYNALAATNTATLLVLNIMIFTSLPNIRRKYHNQWELTHRFGSWTAILLVWSQILIIATAAAQITSQSLTKVLSTTPTFYFLILITLIIIYPWLRLRRRTITDTERLSSHAIRLHFNDRSLTHCAGYRLATDPITENHGFATIPNVPLPVHQRHTTHSHITGEYEQGYSILISNAGDWTSRLIRFPPTKIWTRGAPVLGVMRIAELFSPLVVVATGSGIGPCLSFLQLKLGWDVRIIWSARRPLETYGWKIMEAVRRADRRAVVVDTRITGCERPDLMALAWARMHEGAKKAEAVVVISNPKLTEEVVGGLERRGVPAFGAIFDS